MPAKIMIMKVMAAATAIDPLVITEVVPVMVPVVITEVVPLIVPVVVFALSCEDNGCLQNFQWMSTNCSLWGRR